MTVVDASVLVAAHSEHEGAYEIAQAWLERALLGDLYAPVIALSEVSAAIARSSGDEALAEAVVQSLALSRIDFMPVDKSLALEAAAIGRRQRIRGCDAIYVALASRLGKPLVTLDGEQLTRGAGVAVVLRPGEDAGA